MKSPGEDQMKSAIPDGHLDGAIKSTARKILGDFWTPYLLDRFFKGNSPPEKFFAIVLQIILFDKIIDGRIQIVQHERLRTRDGQREIRPDFTISRQGSQAKFVLECDGYNFHRRTKEEFENELKRERELVLQGFTVVRYSATELFEDPWHCAFEVVDAISSSIGEGQADFQINEQIRELIKMEARNEEIGAGRDTSIEGVVKKIIVLHNTCPYPTYTDCRRYLLGTRSKRGLAKLASIPGYGEYRASGMDRNLLKGAYSQFQILMSKDQALDGQGNSSVELLQRLEEKCKNYCRNHQPSDGQHKEIRLTYKRAYSQWSEGEDRLLLDLIKAKCEITKIATLLQRQPGSIKSRASKLLGESEAGVIEEIPSGGVTRQLSK